MLYLHMSTRWCNRVFCLSPYKISALMVIRQIEQDMHCQLGGCQESVAFRLYCLLKAKMFFLSQTVSQIDNLTLALRISFGRGLKVFAISPIGCSKSKVKSNSIPSFTFIGRILILMVCLSQFRVGMKVVFENLERFQLRWLKIK